MQATILRQVLGLAGWMLVTWAAAVVGGLASVEAGGFYAELQRPGWVPPAWLFGPVWTVLYLMMGLAAWLVWRERGFSASRSALGLYLLQLVANALWSWIFFVWQDGALAFAEVCLLWGLIFVTMKAFWRVRLSAGLLLLPYLAWVTFAAVLTLRLWQLNPEILG